MSNLNRNSRVLLLVTALAFFYNHAVDGGVGVASQWQILTKLNYSSQIRVHPYMLLLVTVPWCGETRSLMKELGHVIASDDAMLGTLKLMVLYKNMERMLANALGATDGITVIYYRDAVPYKYHGRLRVQNILSSLHYVMSFSPDELPLKFLTTSDQLEDFLHSTDRSVLLFEFCGWTRRLLAMNKSRTESDLGKDYHESDGTCAAKEKDNPKVMEDDKLSCPNENGFIGVHWSTQFAPVNVSLVKEAENITLNSGESCDLYEFQKFEGFLQELVIFAREFFLPPERLRFAMVTERSRLRLLNIEEPGPWLMTVYFAGCPSCSQVLKEVDDLRTVLQARSSPVSELEFDPQGIEDFLSAKRPSMLLFVDRSSDSMQIRRESQEALDAFRELANHSEMSNHITGQAIIRPHKTTESNRAPWNTPKHPRLHPFPSSQKLIGKNKMSLMIMNEGQQVNLENLVPDLQSRSVHEILTFAMKQKKELKLSLLAKDAGFQLLSKDFDIEVLESLPSHSEDQSNPSDVKYIMQNGKDNSLDKSILSSVEPQHHHHHHHHHNNNGKSTESTDGAQNWNLSTRYSGIDGNEQPEDFIGSFHFLDGEYRLLETLTGGSMIPSVVIIDPISQKHYVLTESAFNYSSLSVFVNDFLAGKLTPYLQSAAIVPSSRYSPKPPFVNLDFHETDSIPQVTTRTFSELVLGNKYDTRKSGHRDRNILVLFSNSWCGFCQRMELVVREVYRCVNGYASMKISSKKENLMLAGDDILKFPLIYMMDCTQNDCSSILKPTTQREDYPLLLLFPAERKNNTVPYEGDIAVSAIIKFLASHGSHVITDLILHRSFLHDQSSVAHGQKVRSMHHKVEFKDSLQNTAAVKNEFNGERPRLVPGCVLIATDILHDVRPFDGSEILLVKADQIAGFRGLIFNKRLSWDSFDDDDAEGGLGELKAVGAHLSFGGPVATRGMPLVALSRKFIRGESYEVLPNIYFVDESATRSLLEKIKRGDEPADDYWFFMGCSSWGWEQLFDEVARGAWDVRKRSMEKLEWPWR